MKVTRYEPDPESDDWVAVETIKGHQAEAIVGVQDPRLLIKLPDNSLIDLVTYIRTIKRTQPKRKGKRHGDADQ